MSSFWFLSSSLIKFNFEIVTEDNAAGAVLGAEDTAWRWGVAERGRPQTDTHSTVCEVLSQRCANSGGEVTESLTLDLEK